MTASSQTNNEHGEDHVLVCGVNWLGDAVMCMPAMRLYMREQSPRRLTVVVKRRMAGLWGMMDFVDAVLPYEPGLSGMLDVAREIRRSCCDRAFVLPNSFRSALIPFLGRVPVRTGVGTQLRSPLLTEALPFEDTGGRHQAFEYLRIMGLEEPRDGLPPTVLSVPEQARAAARERLSSVGNGGPAIGFMPGAARGPSKRWPAEHFMTLGRELHGRGVGKVVVFGSRTEELLCRRIAAGIGGGALSMAGETDIPGLAALLAECRAVVTNDSGGMHLAAAVGSRVVAVFGLTDPSRTGPLGSGHRVISRKDVAVSRDIGRCSGAAEACLRSIMPQQVLEAVLEVLSE